MTTANSSMRQGWLLACPSPDGGILSNSSYNAGPGLADDTDGATPEDSYMQVVSGVTQANYKAYTNKLLGFGCTQILSHALGKNQFSEFTRDEYVFHVSFFAKTGEIRVVQDATSTPLSKFAYSTVGEEKTTLYQYGLYYDPNNHVTDRTVNCGMLYIIKLSDNSLMIIDGGHLYQSSDETIEELWRFMHEITDTVYGDIIRIAMWYITHAHSDHMVGITKLLNRHHDEIDLQRVMYNIPSLTVCNGGSNPELVTIKQLVRRFYPDLLFLKPHIGQVFSLSDVKLEILYTHEDAILSADVTRFPLGDFNCTSTVLKMNMDGQSILFLGDISVEAEEVITRITDSDIWKADVVQVAHHCFNYLDTLYGWIAAPVALLPNSYFGGHTPENIPKLNSILQYIKDDQIYYEGEGTNGFQVIDDKFTCVYEADVVGKEYDHSGL